MKVVILGGLAQDFRRDCHKPKPMVEIGESNYLAFNKLYSFLELTILLFVADIRDILLKSTFQITFFITLISKLI